VRQYFVYILASSKNGTLYIGVTGNLERRMNIHQSSTVSGFTQKYQVHNLVYYEIHSDPNEAIKREKQIKKWKRFWKINLINSINPNWEELEY
jgi:putative endonuclease